MELKDILAKCDHTLLTQTATWAEIKGVCDDGMKYHTASVCIPASYVKVNGDIYAKIQYNYAPDENMEPLNDAESTIAVEELMTPIVEMLVVRTENLETENSGI